MNAFPEFLKPLEFLTCPFPRDAVEQAIVNREECIPHLLQALEWADAHPDEANDADPPYMLHLFALFLLAQFRETAACSLIIRLFRNPKYDELTGDIVTEDLDRILASVCGGDTRMIEELIEDPSADEWVRGSAIRALSRLVHAGAADRSVISSYFGELFAGKLEEEPGNYWDTLVDSCVELGMVEHLESIRRLHREQMVDDWFRGLEVVEREILLPPESPDRWPRYRSDLIEDTVSEMQGWPCFSEEKPTREEHRLDVRKAILESFAKESDSDEESDYSRESIRSKTKIGRNDPCPCGSGKKYKHCCGNPAL